MVACGRDKVSDLSIFFVVYKTTSKPRYIGMKIRIFFRLFVEIIVFFGLVEVIIKIPVFVLKILNV